MTNSFVCGCYCVWVSLCVDVLCVDVIVCGCYCVWMSLCVDVLCVDVFVCGCFVCGYLCLWVSLRVDVFACGCYCVWMLLCVDVIVCGCHCVDVFGCGCICVWMSFTVFRDDRTMNVHRTDQPTTLGQIPLCGETIIDGLQQSVYQLGFKTRTSWWFCSTKTDQFWCYKTTSTP